QVEEGREAGGHSGAVTQAARQPHLGAWSGLDVEPCPRAATGSLEPLGQRALPAPDLSMTAANSIDRLSDAPQAALLDAIETKKAIHIPISRKKPAMKAARRW